MSTETTVVVVWHHGVVFSPSGTPVFFSATNLKNEVFVERSRKLNEPVRFV
jgi:hypothetical protein